MSLEFVSDLQPIYCDPVSVTPLVTRVLAENPSPYTYTGTGTYMVGRTEVAIIDPGPMMIAHGEALLAALEGKTLTHILVTHTHIDHSPLSDWLAQKTKARTYGFGPHGSGRTGGLDGETVEMGADKEFVPDVILKDGDTVSGPDWTIKAVHTPGHTSNHLCFHLTEENALFTGDHIMGWATTVISPPDGDMRAYLASTEKLLDLAPDLMIPTHGPVIEKTRQYLRGTLVHRRMREGQIVKHLQGGKKTIPELVASMYKDVDPRLHGAAARSVLGHLIAMVDEGKVQTSGSATLDALYKLPE